jgi:lipoate-protein ligase A
LIAIVDWGLLLDSPRPGWENMAIDAALLDQSVATGAAFLRLYRWEPYCLSFGRHEPAGRRYDRSRIRASGLDCVRRPTGGRAVWHARELTYSVAAPLAAFGGLRQAYGAVHGILAAALRGIGARPTLAGPPAKAVGPGEGPCFASPVGGEVLIDGRKVVGSAQLRQGEAFLQHGSLLLEDDQSLVRSLAGLPIEGSQDAPLSRLLGRPIGFEEAAEAVAECAGLVLGRMTGPDGVPETVLAGAEAHAERFRSEAWTWQR